jgi:hypothetical protein
MGLRWHLESAKVFFDLLDAQVEQKRLIVVQVQAPLFLEFLVEPG